LLDQCYGLVRERLALGGGGGGFREHERESRGMCDAADARDGGIRESRLEHWHAFGQLGVDARARRRVDVLTRGGEEERSPSAGEEGGRGLPVASASEGSVNAGDALGASDEAEGRRPRVAGDIDCECRRLRREGAGRKLVETTCGDGARQAGGRGGAEPRVHQGYERVLLWRGKRCALVPVASEVVVR
jgi:hypothetical protein